MSQFSGKRVLITGAGGGIGRLMAQEIASLGAELVLWDIDESALKELADEFRSKGHKASAYKCNLANREELKRLANSVLNELGPIDILINNAGVVAGKPLLENTDEEIEWMFNVNALSSIHLIRAFLPAMVERQQGHIVFVSSASAVCATSRLVVYSATKYAMEGLEEALRFELKRFGYQVKTTIAFPYYIDTGLFAGVKTRFPLLLPILKPQKVAHRIINAIQHDEQRVFMPRFVYVALIAKILPIRFFDFLAEFFGINRSMDEFQGRNQKQHPKEKDH